MFSVRYKLVFFVVCVVLDEFYASTGYVTMTYEKLVIRIREY